MKAQQGDHIILAPPHIEGQTRDGEIVEVRGDDGAPPYLVAWSDGHEGLIYPGPGSVLRIESARHEDAAPAPTAPPRTVGSAPPGPGHVRDWEVRISIFESQDETDARVVLLSDAPSHLTASGRSRRGHRDPAVPEIGDEVAVARALRRLADHLLDAAAKDIEGVTGEHDVVLKAR